VERGREADSQKWEKEVRCIRKRRDGKEDDAIKREKS
jgi:hypothetical protein